MIRDIALGQYIPGDSLVHRMDPGVRQKGREWTRFRAASTALDLVRRLLTGAPVEYERI